jgi:cephalosporin-C deacetylase-like acetyl esterase
MRRDVSFTVDGATLRGWLDTPNQTAQPCPAVVLCPGLGALKEWLEPTIAAFTGAGISCLTFDMRGFGESGGEPRYQADPWAQVRDVRQALTLLQTFDEVDPDRTGVWGTSYGGGVAIVAAAVDRRVRCVVAQVPVVSWSGTMRALATPEQLTQLSAGLEADRRQQLRGEPGAVLAQVSNDPSVPAITYDAETYDWLMASAATTPSWPNKLTLHTIDKLLEFEPVDFLPRLAGTPILMLVAAKDGICPPELSLRAYDLTPEPKRLQMLDGGHYCGYQEQFSLASTTARDWLSDTFGSGRDVT